MKILRVVAIVFGVYVLLGLSLDAAVGYFQPRDDTTAVLRTFDADGGMHETVLRPRTGDDQLWLVSGQWFRGWYYRALANPDVELQRGDTVAAYRATPVDSPQDMAAILHLERERTTAVRYWFGRAVLTLFAPVKLLRLEPRQPNSE